MSRFDRVILAVVLALALTIGVLSIASAGLGPTVDSVTMAQLLDGTSVNTQIGITFTEPMAPQSVFKNFSMVPKAPGDFTWSGNEVFFTPKRPLTYDTRYTITIGTDAQDKSGKHLSRAFGTSFNTQDRHLTYLSRGRLILASLAGRKQTVDSGGGVTEFSVSFDRSLVVYVKRGSSGEQPDQLWLLSLFDNSSQQVFDHPGWSLSQPHFSPDGVHIVFLATNILLCQKYYGCYLDKAHPVVYILDLRTRKAVPFHSQSVPITNFIDFSPSGQVAYTDLGSALTLANISGNHVIHIPNRGNSLEFAGFSSQGDKASFVGQTLSSTGGEVLVYEGSRYIDVSHGVYDSSVPSFSTSGNEIAYSGYRGEQGIEPIYGVNVYNFKSRQTRRLGVRRGWSDWAPQWSSDDRYIAFIRSRPQEAMYMGTGEIWVSQNNGKNQKPLGDVGTNLLWVS
jgi:Tol biopolymer transport system component